LISPVSPTDRRDISCYFIHIITYVYMTQGLCNTPFQAIQEVSQKENSWTTEFT
jgi:hypothetical protein